VTYRDRPDQRPSHLRHLAAQTEIVVGPRR
jgi:hypothetical protein